MIHHVLPFVKGFGLTKRENLRNFCRLLQKKCFTQNHSAIDVCKISAVQQIRALCGGVRPPCICHESVVLWYKGEKV